jgi:pimeloyl-ACP methyl ester carboxylesterase
VVGYSGGGTYALGCAAALGARVRAVVTLAAIAPYGGDGLDWLPLFAANAPKWATTTSYGGDRVTVHPPTGADTTFADALGHHPGGRGQRHERSNHPLHLHRAR